MVWVSWYVADKAILVGQWKYYLSFVGFTFPVGIYKFKSEHDSLARFRISLQFISPVR